MEKVKKNVLSFSLITSEDLHFHLHTISRGSELELNNNVDKITHNHRILPKSHTSTAGAGVGDLACDLDSSIFSATSATTSLVRSSPAIRAAAINIVKTALQLVAEI